MTARDPRTNPQPGDVTKNTDGVEFHVRDVDRYAVTYQENGTGEILDCSLSEWREYAAHDTIIQRGAP